MSNKHRFSWTGWVVLLLLLAGGAAGVYWYLKKGETPAEYQTATVDRGNLTQIVTATGQLAPVVNVQVGSQISGIIRRLYADFNSVVKSNQVIAEIDRSTYQINVQKAEAQLANSKASLALAQVQARRAETLFADRLVSNSDFDTARAQLQQAEAQVQSDEAALESAKVQLSYCTIFSPVDGVVISRNVDVGQTVAASFNTPTLFSIAGDLTKMQIDALVSEADIGGVAVGQDVLFTVDAYPYVTFNGRVSQIRYGAVTNQNVVNYDCVIAVENPDLRLLPSMTANVSIIIAERQNALKIPNTALRFRPVDGGDGKTNGAPSGAVASARRSGERGERGGGAAGSGKRGRPERQALRTVYTLAAKMEAGNAQGAKPAAVQIKVGISDGSATEVIEGLEPGELVVIGMAAPDSGSASKAPSNPFGGMRRF